MEKSKDSFFCSMNIFFNTVLKTKPLELDTHKFVTCLKRILNGWKLIKWSHGRSWIIFSQIIWPIPRHILILNNLIYHNGDSIFALNCVIKISTKISTVNNKVIRISKRYNLPWLVAFLPSVPYSFLWQLQLIYIFVEFRLTMLKKGDLGQMAHVYKVWNQSLKNR